MAMSPSEIKAIQGHLATTCDQENSTIKTLKTTSSTPAMTLCMATLPMMSSAVVAATTRSMAMAATTRLVGSFGDDQLYGGDGNDYN